MLEDTNTKHKKHKTQKIENLSIKEITIMTGLKRKDEGTPAAIDILNGVTRKTSQIKEHHEEDFKRADSNLTRLEQDPI